MTKLEEQGMRLESLLAILEIDQTDLARLSERSPSLINQIIKGRKKLSNAVLTGLTNSYSSVNLTWLLSGIGEPLNEKRVVKDYQFEEGEPRTLRDLEEDYEADPLYGLKEMLKDYGNRIAALEERQAAMERDAKIGSGS